MSDKFRPLAHNYFVSPQLTPADVKEAAAMGVKLIINNRPDGEEPGQPAGAAIEKAAREAGISYIAIPMRDANVGDAHLSAYEAAMTGVDGPVLSYCRSGTRSTLLRSFARAQKGDDVEAIIEDAADAGYDLSSLRARLRALSPA